MNLPNHMAAAWQIPQPKLHLLVVDDEELRDFDPTCVDALLCDWPKVKLIQRAFRDSPKDTPPHG